jgi:stage II sporulation protein D
VQIRGKRRALRFPVVFEPGATVLSVNGNAYRGSLRVLRDGRRLDVVNDVRMEFYVRGVVPWEMPYRWHLGALAAQAVAARSFALTELGSRGTFDLYPDTRDQMYGGVRAETTRTNRAVARTARQVLVWNGAVARTYYSSTSGGRTQALPGVPYLRSVSDPYDRISPHHRWGPLRYSRRQLGRLLHLPAPTAVHVARNVDGRARSVYVRWRGGGSSVSASDFQRRLGLRSTWFWVGPIAPSRPAAEARARAKNRTRQSATSHRRRKPQHRQA